MIYHPAIVRHAGLDYHVAAVRSWPIPYLEVWSHGGQRATVPTSRCQVVEWRVVGQQREREAA